jgi:dTDP-4-dehydrorhamnose 3,5-epimerase
MDGVRVRPIVTHQDSRGSLGELFSLSWATDEPPIVHAYFVTVRPGRVKGWAIHNHQLDRYAFISGSLKLVLFDYRDQSRTYRHVNELYFGETNRSLVSVPAGIFHAVENVGLADALMFNFPDVPYNYEAPDKSTLPLENTIIPYTFSSGRGY